MRKLIKIIFHVYIEHTSLEYKQIKLELNFHDWRIDGTMCWLSTRTKVRAYLFETFLADGLRIDLHLEDDGIGLADKTPHLCFDHSFLGDLWILVLIPRRQFLLARERKTQLNTFIRDAHDTYTRQRRRWQQSFGRIRGWSATGRARWYLLCHNKSFKKQVRAQLSPRRARARLHAISATCSLLYRRTNASRQLPFLGAEWHTHWHRSSLSRLSSRNRIAIPAALYRVALAPSAQQHWIQDTQNETRTIGCRTVVRERGAPSEGERRLGAHSWSSRRRIARNA